MQKIFTYLRNILYNKEDELLLKIDKVYDNLFFNKDIFKEFEK